MLTPEIMPNTWKFSTERGINFTKHYSGGNGTRMGMFTQFYGLPGRYWFDFMDEQKPPVLLTALQEKQYDIKIYSGAKFSYPEFDKTIFSTIRNENMQDNTNKQLGETGWEADRRNTTDLINSLKNIENEKNFMRFQFFESAHARYYFPEDSIIRDDYLKSVNYATMSMEKDMPQIFNRYINSVHHLDQQIGKILNHLTSTGLIDNTIVIITGDHGEEFMENGHWGHNSEFTNEQTQVPLVISIPNEQPRQVNRLTSHSDLPATLLPLLGVINSPADYSTGNDLLSDKQSDFITITDWNRICIVKNNMKIYHAIDTKAWFSNRITTIDDKPIIESDSPTSKTHFGLLKSAQHQLLSFKAVKH